MQNWSLKYQGDKEKAQQDFETNVIILFTNKVSFFDILVNSVNQNDMSPSLRKLALLLMKEWIINAHNDFTANYRKAYPQNITIKISDWSGTTKDGSNVNELLESYNNFLQDIFNLDKEVIYDVKIDKHREKRSINANNYLWELCTQIGNVLRKSKEEVYFEMLVEYGQSIMVSVLSPR